MAELSSASVRGLGSRLRIILAEDDFEMRRMVAEGLRRDGHEVTELDHGGQVLERLTLPGTGALADVADLLVTDVQMPCVDGLTLVRALRSVGWTRPTVMMTAFGDEETHEKAADLGALILDKPFPLHDLRQLVIYAGRIGTVARESLPPSSRPPTRPSR